MGVATTIDPLMWQELVIGADFLGIIECEVAGGIVAKYKIVESWKGPPAGNVVSLRVAVNAWEPQFPIALCGERFLVAAYKSPPSTMMSTTSYGPVPLWWRRIPADYQTPLFQGVARIDGKEPALHTFGAKHSSLAAFKRDAVELLEQPMEKREERLLKAQAEKYLARTNRSSNGEKTEKLDDLQRGIERAKSASELVELLLTEAGRRKERAKGLIEVILRRGGGEVALAAIEKLPPNKSPFEENDRKRMVEVIRERLGHRDEQDERDREKPKPPTEQQLAKLRALVKAQRPLRDVGEALEILTVHDPAPVAEYLVQWVNPDKDWSDHDMGYSLGSYFAWRCGRNRKENLSKLLSAHDKFIRVAGAVYLCFEDRELGLQKLKDFSRLDGDPGVWAALNRARRGDKSAMPRALEVFSTAGPSNMAGVPHRNLQKRLIVLFSNTAHASGLAPPQPPFVETDDEGRQSKLYEFYKSWWDSNADKAVITDPWLKMLEEQKVQKVD
jgi:hypothetical protein